LLKFLPQKTKTPFGAKPRRVPSFRYFYWTNTIEIPKVSEFTVESQLQNIDYEYEAYHNQEKKLKKIVLDINKNKENFYPKESKSLFKEYVEVVKILKINLKEIKKELKNNKKNKK